MIQKTAAQMGREINEDKLDPVELTESVFEKIHASGIKDDVFARLTEERALSEAEAARTRQKSGNRLGLLDGVPVSWKDLFDTKDIATEAGSLLLKGRIPDEDCEVLKRATAAGTVCIGKTHMSELAFSGLGINPRAATPPNIHGPELAPGGSSSGAGASVAHGFVPMGIGSDTGGSVRIPSAWNDLVGLKTTAGLLPNDGVVSLCSGFDTVGPLCLDVEDAALMFGILKGEMANSPESKPLSECRFLVNETVVLDDCSKDQIEGFEFAIEALAKAGALVHRAPIDIFNDIAPLGPVLFPYEAWREWGEMIEANPGLMFEPLYNRFSSGIKITREAYDSVWAQMLALRESYLSQTHGYDAVLSPTVPIGPPEVASLLADYELFGATNMMALRNTRFGNMFGLSGLTLPTSRKASGILFSAAPLAEDLLLSIGLAAEKVI